MWNSLRFTTNDTRILAKDHRWRGELKNKKAIKKQKHADMISLCDHKMDTTNNNNNIFTLLIQYKC